MKQLNNLLAQISLIKKEYDIVRNKQEKFNIFSVLHKPHDEVRLHSRFVAAILNPNGSHGFGKEFLNIFLQKENINIKNFENAIVLPDENIKSEYKNIDILIIDRVSKHAVVIENKIYAYDSNNEEGGQLERYFKIVRDEEEIPKENIKVFYLTLDNHEPSEGSLGKYKTLEAINAKCISYPNEIIKWIDECIKLCVDKPFLRESLIQYKKLIKQLTMNETDVKERIKIKDLIAETKQNMDSTKYLIDNFKHVKWHAIYDFWKDIEVELDNRKYKITESIKDTSITALTHSGQNSSGEDDGIYFEFAGNNRALIFHEKYSALWFGFEIDNLSDEIREKLNELVENKKIQEGGVHFWEYFEDSNGEKLFLKDFGLQNTFNLINPELRKQTAIEVVEVVDTFIKANLI